VVLIAVGVVLFKYWDYVANPWTRDGQVRAQVIQLTPRVSGPIVELPIKDNQLVKAGDLLFQIDPRTFAASLDQARADLDSTRDDIDSLEKQVEAAKASVSQYEAQVKEAGSSIKKSAANLADAKATFGRISRLVEKGAASELQRDSTEAKYKVALAEVEQADQQLVGATAAHLQSKADLGKAQADLGARGDQNAQLRAAKAAVDQAALNLEFTQVRAPVDGYVTNLNLRLGSQAVADQAALALVDVNSYWIDGFFRENYIEDIRAGDRAIVTLMSYPDRPLEGRVDSLGWGIAQDDGSTGFDLLPTISPTFEWIRLAQRVPVRIHLVDVPEGVELRVGTTASVLVMTGSNGSESKDPVAALPRALQ
jgi:multidrug resistance efflux pump